MVNKFRSVYILDRVLCLFFGNINFFKVIFNIFLSIVLKFFGLSDNFLEFEIL